MRLPNITDEMREFQLKCVKNGLWNFIVERKMYSDEEQKTALKLVRAIVNCGDKDRKGDSRPVSRDPFRLSSPSIDRITDILFRVNSPKLAARVTLDDKADLNRFIQLSSLVEPSVAASSQISQALDNASSSLGFSLHSFTSLPALGTPLSISANTSVADLAFGNQTVTLITLCRDFVINLIYLL